jgi:hypothetical protein
MEEEKDKDGGKDMKKKGQKGDGNSQKDPECTQS